MKPVHVLLALILFGVSIPSCASSGNPAVENQDLVAQIKLGQSTKEDVRRLFGQPTVMSRHSGTPFPAMTGWPVSSSNYEIWNYTYANTEVHPATFIPIVGLFAGSATSKMSQITLAFDEQGIVRHIQTGQTQATGGPGASPAQ